VFNCVLQKQRPFCSVSHDQQRIRQNWLFTPSTEGLFVESLRPFQAHFSTVLAKLFLFIAKAL
jgi:hypothetical protein